MTVVRDESEKLLYVGNPPACSEKNPLGSGDNYACTDAHSVVRRAVGQAQQSPSSFFTMAWGRVNGTTVSPVGVVRYLGDRVWFSFFNRCGIDGPVAREAAQAPRGLEWHEEVRSRLQAGEQSPEQRWSTSITFPVHDGDHEDLIERMTRRIFR